MPASAPIFDAWIQHPSAALLAEPFLAPLLRWLKIDAPVAAPPFEMTLAALDAAGVTHAALTAWWGPRGPLITNDEVAAQVRTTPERLIGVASVPLDRPMEALRELRRAVDVLGLRALRLLPWLWGLPPDDRRYYPLYAECSERGLPFCTQVGHAGPALPSEPGRPIPYLDVVAAEFPDLVIVAGHVGYPWTAEMIALATKYPNVYIDTSAYKPSRYPPELVAFLKGHGRRKVLFGSNAPMILPGDCLAELPALGLDEPTTRAFLFENARRVFGRPAGER